MHSCWHALRRTHRLYACTCATNVFSTFLLPGQPCMSWLDMHPQVQRAKFCNKFSRFSPSSAFGRASIALRRPAKAKPVSCWSKLAANVSSRCFQRCWFACGKDNTNASYSGMTALHPGPRRCAPRAGIRRSCPHTRVVLSTYLFHLFSLAALWWRCATLSDGTKTDGLLSTSFTCSFFEPELVFLSFSPALLKLSILPVFLYTFFIQFLFIWQKSSINSGHIAVVRISCFWVLWICIYTKSKTACLLFPISVNPFRWNEFRCTEPGYKLSYKQFITQPRGFVWRIITRWPKYVVKWEKKITTLLKKDNINSPCWMLNIAEHISSARHDQLAFLSRSDLSPQMPSKFSRYRFRETTVQHLWKAWSKDEKVEEKCLSKESSTGSHFIISLSLFLILFILNQRYDELIRFISKVVELLHGEPNVAVGVPNLPISHEEWWAHFSSSLSILFAITALPLLPSSLSLFLPPPSLSLSLSLSPPPPPLSLSFSFSSSYVLS